VPEVGADIEEVGAYLLHSEGKGDPHCVGLLARKDFRTRVPQSSSATFPACPHLRVRGVAGACVSRAA
jgi:hypothetical protein